MALNTRQDLPSTRVISMLMHAAFDSGEALKLASRLATSPILIDFFSNASKRQKEFISDLNHFMRKHSYPRTSDQINEVTLYETLLGLQDSKDDFQLARKVISFGRKRAIHYFNYAKERPYTPEFVQMLESQAHFAANQMDLLEEILDALQQAA